MNRLATPQYACALALLLTNDLWLKRTIPGFITGKLSDLAGLFCLTVFALAFTPRGRGVACAAIAIAFTAWKLPVAEPAIAFWNAHSPYQIDRVVDPSDLTALAVIPVAYIFVTRSRKDGQAGLPVLHLRTAIALMSLFAFAATSYARYRFEVPEDYALRRVRVELPATTVVARLERCNLEPFLFEIEENSAYIHIIVRYTTTVGPRKNIQVHGVMSSDGGATVLDFRDIDVFRPSGIIDEAAVMIDFGRAVEECLARPPGPGRP